MAERELLRKPSPGFPESAADRFLSAHLSNAQYNKLVWGLYPAVWGIAARLRGKRDAVLGQEWGRRDDITEIIDEYIRPNITRASVVGEIGVGGGRIATQIVAEVERFYSLDVSRGMLKKAREALRDHANVEYVRLNNAACPPQLVAKLDFVYAFDVFVHFDLHAMWRHLLVMRRLLRPGGRAFVHVANLAAPLGWEKFSRQKAFSVGGLYFVTPETVEVLASHSGFQTITASSPDPRNDYLNRDYLAVLETAGGPPG